MTTLTHDVAPDGAAARPLAESPTRTQSLDSDPVPAPQRLGAAVIAGRRALENLCDPGQAVGSGDLGRAMRAALTHHRQRATTTATTPATTPATAAGRSGDAVDPHRWDRAAISVRIACAHLDAGNLIEARLALDTAHDALPHQDQQAPGADAARSGRGPRPAKQARAAVRAQQRGLSAHALIDQAVGVLAGHSQVSPSRARSALRRHARRHRLVDSELASDIVAGRVPPQAIVASSIKHQARRGA